MQKMKAFYVNVRNLLQPYQSGTKIESGEFILGSCKKATLFHFCRLEGDRKAAEKF